MLLLNYRFCTAEIFVSEFGYRFAKNVLFGHAMLDGVSTGDDGLGYLLTISNTASKDNFLDTSSLVKINGMLDAFLKYWRRLSVPGCRTEHDSGICGQSIAYR